MTNLQDSNLIVKYVKIWDGVTADNTNCVMIESTDTIVDDNVNGLGHYHSNNADNEHRMMANRIIGMGLGYFTVDDTGVDGFPNENGVTYNYMVLGTYI